MPDLAVLVVLGLAAFRATRIVTSDKITIPFRQRLYDFAWDDLNTRVNPDTGDDEPSPRAPWRTWLHALLTCQMCLGFWVCIAAYCTWRWAGDLGLAILAVLAVAGTQILFALAADLTDKETHE